MSIEIDISQLNDLRKEVSRLLEEANRLTSRNEAVMAGVGRAVPIVIVFYGTFLTVCYRSEKSKYDTEVIRVTQKDATEGPTHSRLDRYVTKVAAFLERRGLYQPRGAITDKTPNLFDDEKVKKVKI